MKQIKIFDTTLRDGSQGAGIAFSVEDKLKIASALDTFGISFIEGGWPGANPKDEEFFKLAKNKFKNSKLYVSNIFVLGKSSSSLIILAIFFGAFPSDNIYL